MKNFAKLIVLAVIAVMTVSSCKKEEITINNSIPEKHQNLPSSTIFYNYDLRNFTVSVPNLQNNSIVDVYYTTFMEPSDFIAIPDSTWPITGWNHLPHSYSDSTHYVAIYYMINYNAKTITVNCLTNAYPSNWYLPAAIRVDIN